MIRNLVAPLMLIVAILLVHVRVVQFDFVSYDDTAFVSENPAVRAGVTIEGLSWALTTFHGGNFQPMTWLSHMLDCELFGLDPAGHHLTSLLLHIVNTLLLYIVLVALTHRRWVCGLVAALFALHPLHVESVAWISQRKDLLSSFWGFATIGAYVWYTKGPRMRRYLLVMLLLAAGLMSKPVLVTLPVLLLVLDYWPLQRLTQRSGAGIYLSQAHEPSGPFLWKNCHY